MGTTDMDFDVEWDDNKAILNAIKHGISFEEAATSLSDPNLYTEFDGQHYIEEKRYIRIGFSDWGRLLLVIHTLRGETIRIISARPCTAQEARFYDEG
jgi:uncharacterized protein